MTSREQRRTWILTKLLVGELTISEAAAVLGLSERHIWRLRRAFEAAGPKALVHGNRGRPSPRRLAADERARIIELARTSYAGTNDTHLAELLAEREGLSISRASLQRLLRSAAVCSACCAALAWPAHAGAERRATAAGVSGCPRRACSCRPTARVTTGWRAAVHG